MISCGCQTNAFIGYEVMVVQVHVLIGECCETYMEKIRHLFGFIYRSSRQACTYTHKV